MEFLNNNSPEGKDIPFTKLFRSKKVLILTRRSSAEYFIKTYGLRLEDADPISWFIYLVNGETNSAFVETIEHWVREIFLLTGSVQSILETIAMQWLPEIDEDDEMSCVVARAKVIRSVQEYHPIQTRPITV